ncbi:hypothetical protein [Enterovibrio coralii]|uniref:Uncharacterized protein n=1 Tax=Enterovibrio coralii TaxID=294935 RepID=A0A135I726_9GAMM|nr:hypothetical protein [Enterovibrio coralii]KXF81217.1 hypothetical protein ATN88_00145 [Enterovibrio coralii]
MKNGVDFGDVRELDSILAELNTSITDANRNTLKMIGIEVMQQQCIDTRKDRCAQVSGIPYDQVLNHARAAIRRFIT